MRMKNKKGSRHLFQAALSLNIPEPEKIKIFPIVGGGGK